MPKGKSKARASKSSNVAATPEKTMQNQEEEITEESFDTSGQEVDGAPSGSENEGNPVDQDDDEEIINPDQEDDEEVETVTAEEASNEPMSQTEEVKQERPARKPTSVEDVDRHKTKQQTMEDKLSKQRQIPWQIPLENEKVGSTFTVTINGLVKKYPRGVMIEVPEQIVFEILAPRFGVDVTAMERRFNLDYNGKKDKLS